MGPFAMKKVEITWVDSKGVTTAWEDRDGLAPLLPCHITSIGFLLEETEEYVTLTQSIGGDQVLGRITIPRGVVKKVRVLR